MKYNEFALLYCVCVDWISVPLSFFNRWILFFLFLEQNYDSVEIRDGDKDYSELLTPAGGFSGNVTHSVTASGNVMWIKFNADYSVNFKGFNLTYEAVGKLARVSYNFLVYLNR